MFHIILQTTIENKEFLEKSLEKCIENNKFSLFSKDLKKVFDCVGNLTFYVKYDIIKKRLLSAV